MRTIMSVRIARRSEADEFRRRAAVVAARAAGLLATTEFHVTLTDMETASARPYRMGARAEAAAATGERILDAAVRLFWERPTDQISLDDVARGAGVSVQTVIRRFGGKDGLLAAAVAPRGSSATTSGRSAPVGDVAAAVAVLVEHYELRGDRVLRLLAEEPRVPGLAELVDQGRARAPGLVRPGVRAGPRPDCRGRAPAPAGPARRRLRRLHLEAAAPRRRAEPAQTELALVELLRPIVEGS